MGTAAPFFVLLCFALVIGLLVWFVRAVNRLVAAQEHSARAIERVAHSVEQLAQSVLPAGREAPR